MKKIVLMFLIGITLISCSKKGKITGSVIDGVTSKPIEQAEVSVQAMNLTTKTNSNGKYKISDLNYGNYKIKIKKENYATSDFNLVIDKHHRKIYQPTEMFTKFLTSSKLEKGVKEYLLKKKQRKDKWFRFKDFKIKSVKKIDEKTRYIDCNCSFAFSTSKPGLTIMDAFDSDFHNVRIIYKLSENGWRIQDTISF